MTQLAVPAEDTTNQGWFGFFGAADEWPPVANQTEIYAAVAEQDDNSKITSPDSPNPSVYVTKLSDIVNPEDLEGDWTVSFRAAKPTGIVTTLNLTVQLRQFYVDETDALTIGELIAEMTVNDVPDTLTDYAFVVPDTSFVAATDLYLRVIATI